MGPILNLPGGNSDRDLDGLGGNADHNSDGLGGNSDHNSDGPAVNSVVIRRQLGRN